MPRYPKGILGVAKKPGSQMLFSFRARDGEEWPSDSEDSDYNPGPSYGSDSDEPTEQKPSTSKKPLNHKDTRNNKKPSSSNKRKASTQHKGKKRTKRSKDLEEELPEVTAGLKSTVTASDSVEQSVTVKPFRGSLPPLPPEIWEKIFGYIVQQDGALPFLDRARKVCKLWRDVSESPSLWRYVDISKGMASGWKCPTTMAGFTRFVKKYLGSSQILNFANCNTIMAWTWAVKIIADNCPELRSINLSYCRRLPNGSIDTLTQKCPKLEDIDISYTTAASISSPTVEGIAKRCGGNLKRLVLSHNMSSAFSQHFKSLMTNCPNLQHIDISNMRLSTYSVSLSIETLHRHFPHLKSLYISNTPIRIMHTSVQDQEASPGFPHLEELSLASTGTNSLTFNEIIRFCKNASKLRLLDLRGCSMPAVRSLEHIIATDVEQLFLSKSRVTYWPELSHVARRWSHSLTHLDLSWMSLDTNILKATLEQLGDDDNPNYQLTHLDLTGTNVDMNSIKHVLRCARNLKDLSLSSCRDVHRGYKRQYLGLDDINSLRRTLKIALR